MSDDSKNSEVSLERVLDLLDRWRHLPAYQLERRVDVLFALFLPEVLEKRFCTSNLHLIPEFPIKKSVYSGDTTAQSINVDFLAVEKVEDGERAGRAFLVELKTDMASKGEKQAEDLGRAANVGLKELVAGVIDIAGATPYKKKYVHLLRMLADLQLIEYEDDLFPVRRVHYRSALKTIQDSVDSRKEWPSLELVYVQPTTNVTNVINFNEFADTVEEVDRTDIRRKFACYLREWAAREAGERDPRRPSSC